MKRILTMILALAMLLACAALAEEAEVQYVESQTGLFTMEVPAGYLVVNGDLAEMMRGDADDDMLKEYFDWQGLDGSAFVAAKDSYDFASFEGRDIIIGPDIVSNMNTTTVENTGIDMAMLEMLGDQLGAQMIDLYVQMGISADACSVEGMLTFGENEYFAIFVEEGEMALHQYMIINDEGSMITYTFTGFDPAVEEAILNSVALK